MAEAERVRRFRALAEELRAVADDLQDAKSRDRYMRMADNYEHLAEVIETAGLNDAAGAHRHR